jgi:hypothetical protein
MLHAAFPWRATVEMPDAGAFVSLRYQVDEADEHGAVLWFERDPGDTTIRVSWKALEKALETGVLEGDGGIVRQPTVEDLSLLADPVRDFLGEQSTSDSAWTARMRLHQTWWRAFRLRVPPGPGPTKKATVLRGSMLDDEAAEAGRNFLTPEVHQVFLERLALDPQGVDPWRTGRNLLASQPMAFNLFGHLRHRPHLASALLRGLLGEDEVDHVKTVELERNSTALGDGTAFDAFATYVRTDGTPGCIAIETKLTEPFSQKAYDWPTYIAHDAFTPGVWGTDDPALLGDLRWSQLFRNHLLAEAESRAFPEVGTPTVLVVHHPDDPHCLEIVNGYRSLLANPDAVRAVDLGVIAHALADHVTAADAEWLQDFRDRYLNLNLSKELDHFMKSR